MKQARYDIYVSREADLNKLGFTPSFNSGWVKCEFGRSMLCVELETMKLTWSALSIPLVVKIIEMAQAGLLKVVDANKSGMRTRVARLTEEELELIERMRAAKAMEEKK